MRSKSLFNGSILAVVLATVFAMGVTTASAAVIDGPVVDPSNGHSYYLLSQDNWTDSEAEAESLGGYLATIRSSAENQWVFNTFGDFGGVTRDLWIGLYDPFDDVGGGAQHAADFEWVDGETTTYRNWAPTQPDNRFGTQGQYYTYIYNQLGGEWDDYENLPQNDSNTPNFGVVEILPDPSSIPLLGLGVTTILRPRKRSGRPKAICNR